MGYTLYLSDFPDVDEKMAEFAQWVAKLGWKKREEVLAQLNQVMCMHCGGPPACYCWNDV